MICYAVLLTAMLAVLKLSSLKGKKKHSWRGRSIKETQPERSLIVKCQDSTGPHIAACERRVAKPPRGQAILKCDRNLLNFPGQSNPDTGVCRKESRLLNRA